MPQHKVKAYTIEVIGTPVATVKAESISDVMRFILDDFEDLTGNGHWDGEEPITIRSATWLEKDALVLETLRREDEDGITVLIGRFEYPYLHTRDSTSREDAACNARSQIAA